jgi:type IV pilus assembly protein PilB
MKPNESGENAVLETLKMIQLGIRSAASYPEDHPAASRAFTQSFAALSKILQGRKTFTISVFGNRLMMDDARLEGKSDQFAAFVRDLTLRGISSIAFHRGLSRRDLRAFFDAMIKMPHAIQEEGGMGSILSRNHISTIKINGVKYGKISSAARPSEESPSIESLNGRPDRLEEFRETFMHLLDEDPRQVADLIKQVAEAKDITLEPYNKASRANAGLEAMSRVCVGLLAKEGLTRNDFTETMTSILSAYDDEALHLMSREMKIIEGERSEIISHLPDELLYDALANICIEGYREKGNFDVPFVERLLPSAEERLRMSSYLRRRLKGHETLSEKEILSRIFCEENGIRAETAPPKDIPVEKDRTEIKEDVKRLMKQGKSEDVQALVKELTEKLDDRSWKVRKKIAESLLEVTSALDELDKLKDYFEEMSEALLKRLREEIHIDVYLVTSESLHRVYASKNKIDSGFNNEILGKTLIEANQLTRDKLQKALLEKRRNGRSLQYNLGALNCIDEAALTAFLAQQYKGCHTVDLSRIHSIPPSVLNIVPLKIVKNHLILPFMLHAGRLFTATMNPNDLNVLNDIRFITGYTVIPHLASEYYLLNAIERFYGIETSSSEITHAIKGMTEEEDIYFSEGKDAQVAQEEELKESDAPVVKLVNMIIKSAVSQNASDIHIEPFEDELRVRFRIDGSLTTVLTPSTRYVNAVSSRIKIMSRLDIAERRLPQDGRFRVRLNGRHVDVRVSCFPGIFGEKLVLRILDCSNLVPDVDNLGLSGSDLTTLLTAIYKSKGMIVVTGPTGSGKTTTLYSLLHALNDGSRNICTAEDPVEYNLKGINQFQMNPKIGLDFARALRTFLRQDPDVIMVGEIRDTETAQIAVKASLTGHLVLSTLHTNSAAETIARMLDMGIEPYLLNSSLSLVVAQRLMKKICGNCKVEDTPNRLQSRLIENHGLRLSDHVIFKGEGCVECNHTGYRGRLAVYEVMPLWQEIQDLIIEGKSSAAVEKKARGLGLVILPEQGFRKVLEGVTSLDEWMRVVA